MHADRNPYPFATSVSPRPSRGAGQGERAPSAPVSSPIHLPISHNETQSAVLNDRRSPLLPQSHSHNWVLKSEFSTLHSACVSSATQNTNPQQATAKSNKILECASPLALFAPTPKPAKYSKTCATAPKKTSRT